MMPPEGGPPLAAAGSSRRERAARFAKDGPHAVVAATVLFNLVFLRKEASVVSTLNDSSFHELMVRYATHQLQLGHFPLDGWFPYLGLGSPLFMHYQSLGATVAGLLGLVIGSDHAFSLMLYLLLSLWPICVYASARLLGLTRWQASTAAVLSPFVTSILGIGYEQPSYLWAGFGVWSQLFGMWLLPFSWGTTARAIRTGRGYAAASALVALTLASHFLTGYLTAPPIVLLPLIRPHELAVRTKRAAVVAIGAALCSLWLLIPLAQFGRFASINEFLQGSPTADSYGARQALRWFADGNLFDSGNAFPVLTTLCVLGLIAAIWHWRRDESTRLVACLFGVCLVLFFGRPTLGPLINALPGSRDLFLRRFIMGVQLAGVYLGGIGLTAAVSVLRMVVTRTSSRTLTSRAGRVAFAGVVGAVVVAMLAPSWTATLASDSRDAGDIRIQMAADATFGPQINELVAQALALGPGRFFAGMPNDVWGPDFTVGGVENGVPVFKYLANLDVDIVGYTLRTASLMTDPEDYFDEYDAADYPLFGVRYLILPTVAQASTMTDVDRILSISGATRVLQVGNYGLYQIPKISYLRVVATEGVITADRTDIGLQTSTFVRTIQALHGPYPVIAYGGAAPASTTYSGSATDINAGSVISSNPDLQEGKISGVVEVSLPSVVVLSASYDPGWHATVDGRPVPTEMVAPALVAAPVGPGRHVVTFRYEPPGYYPELFAIALVALLALVLLPRTLRRRSSRRSPAATSDPDCK